MKIKRILVTQQAPETERSPYHDLSNKYNVKVDFVPFIQVEGVSLKEFRLSRINFLDYTAIIFTSKTAADHYFRLCAEQKITVPDTMKYFCISESTAFYLQKYIVYRKRKIFYANNRPDDLLDSILRFPDEKFLLPISDIHKQEIPTLLDKHKLKYDKAILYRTVSSDLSNIADFNYDVIVFFSPSGVKSLFKNFPKFKQANTLVASFGPATAKAINEAGLRLDIQAPTPQSPSMTMALDYYIRQNSKNCK